MTCGDDFREALTRPWPLPLSIPAVTVVAAAAAASPLPLRYPGFSSPFSRPTRQQRRRPWWVENLAVIVVAILAVVVPPIPDLVVFVTPTRDRSPSRRDGRKRTTQTPNERYRGPAVVVPPAAAEVVVDLRRLPPGFRLKAGVPRRRRADEGVEPVSQGDGGVRVPGPVEEVPLARSAAAYFALRASSRVSAHSSASRIAAFQGSSPFSRKRSVYARDSRSSSSVCRSVFVKRKEVSDGS